MSLTVTARGTFTNNTANTSFTCAVASNCTAGARIVICIAADNSAAAGSSNNINTVTDSLGNTWDKHQGPVFDNGAASAGVQGAIFSTIQNVGTIVTGTTITVSTSATNTTAKTGCFWEITAAAGFRANFRTGADKSAGATGTAATLGASPSVNIGEAIVAAIFMESGTTQTYVGDTDITNGIWNTSQYAEIGSTTSGSCCGSQVKTQITANSTQTYDATLGISSDYHGSYAIFQEVVINTDGTASVTFGALTSAATGVVDIVGISSATLGALATTATGTVAIVGSASQTFDALATTATGAVEIVATSSTTFGALTVTATGTVETAGVSGEADITLGALTSTATGAVDIAATANPTFGALTISATGVVAIVGEASATFGVLTTSATAKAEIVGQANPSLGLLTVTATGKVEIAAASVITLGALATSAAGAIDIAAQANITLGALTITADGTGSITTEGQANITFGALTANSTAQAEVKASFNKSFGALTISATGEVTGIGDIVNSNAQANIRFKPLTTVIRLAINWRPEYQTRNLENAVTIQEDGTTLKTTV